jgi:hypothetical protein
MPSGEVKADVLASPASAAQNNLPFQVSAYDPVANTTPLLTHVFPLSEDVYTFVVSRPTTHNTLPFQHISSQAEPVIGAALPQVIPSLELAVWFVPEETATKSVPFHATAVQLATAGNVRAVHVMPSGLEAAALLNPAVTTTIIEPL